ncbi:uncharacterized protein LOC119986835 [Tripterygium wilfordii]|uniref:uncharacterized protein LOC119986835 n=1 Tax=Tripterygium wilfordii TaxID=458696 RepID=UPI0018F8200E|nr:uncharacterized protein LOC119986835 [Tripterygium wilfordii]
MEVPEYRTWMYNRVGPGRVGITDEFLSGVEEFIDYASKKNSEFENTGKIRCPCMKCKCIRFRSLDDIRMHLYKKVDVPEDAANYYWQDGDQANFNPYEQMVMDAAGPSVRDELLQRDNYNQQFVPEPPNPDAQGFFDMLSAAQAPLWDGCKSHSELSAAMRLLSIKADYNMPQGCFDDVVHLMKETMPTDNRMPANFYQTKKSVSKLGLGYQRIDCCTNGCMIFYKDDANEKRCKFCEADRYKPRRTGRGNFKEIPIKRMWYLPLIPWLQRLFSSTVTAKEMRWHYEHQSEADMLCHPSDGETWKHFDQTYQDFASEPRNIRLGLCADGFTPFGQSGKNYSCWPVILTPYNLPPGMCMKREFMFLTVIIPGPQNPKSRIDVYLQPLIDELKLLWCEGVITYDVAMKENFIMRAALMWTVNDFPAYGMLSGWMTQGKLACPCCMKRSKAFTLKNGRKNSWFDCHRQFLPMKHPLRRNKDAFFKNRVEKSEPPPRFSGEELLARVWNYPKITETGPLSLPGYGQEHNWTKKSIFWDLPYWCNNLLRHNLDVMHIEKNVFDNVFNTCMDVKGKSKDNVKSRMDLSNYCKRRALELVEHGNGKSFKPKAQFCLNMDQKRAVCAWVSSLKWPDGYASNLGRCVDMREGKLFGMKSHDCHVFMQRLLPVAFRALPEPIWTVLTELSHFFRDICSTTLRENQLHIMEDNIPVILCKLERIFPPSFFDSMEHVLVHLPFESRMGGPVQYRWMYPFERYLHFLKKKVKNKAHVEGSICEAYIVEETSMFGSYYFEPNVISRRSRVPRNEDWGTFNQEYPRISIFNQPGRLVGPAGRRYLTDREYSAATLYLFLNCDIVQPFINMYTNFVRASAPALNDDAIDYQIEIGFASWFRQYVHEPQNGITDDIVRSVARGPLRSVEIWHMCYVNGYKFDTDARSEGKSTINSGVCIRGTDYGQSENDYYGVLKEIVQLELTGLPIKKIVLFNCEWFDPTPNRGVRIHKHNGLVEVKHRGRYNKFDPFIIAQQAEQVYFAPYPEGIRDRQDWLAVIKTKARHTITGQSNQVDDAFQDDEVPVEPVRLDTDQLDSLVDNEAEPEEVLDEYSTRQLMIEEENDEDDEELQSYDSEIEEESENCEECYEDD